MMSYTHMYSWPATETTAEILKARQIATLDKFLTWLRKKSFVQEKRLTNPCLLKPWFKWCRLHHSALFYMNNILKIVIDSF